MSASPESNLNKDVIFAHPGRPGNSEHRSGRSPGGKQGTTKSTSKIYAPIGVQGTITSPYGEPNHGSPPHVHHGVDYAVPAGTACIAPTDGVISGRWDTGFGDAGGMLQFKFTEDVGDIKAGTVIGWGHMKNARVSVGDKVTGGKHLCDSNHPKPHVHFIQRRDSNDMDGTENPTPLLLALQKGKTSPTSGGSGDPSGGSGGSSEDMAATARAAALSTFLELPAVLNSYESNALAGQKSLMNDQPLLPFIEQLCQASLRNFQSMPNGNFFAFFPDYFGGLSHRTAYWQIDDIEIIDGQIELSDDALATHVYIVGDTVSFDGAIDTTERLQTSGVVTIFNAFAADFINGITDDKTNPSNPKAQTDQEAVHNGIVTGDHPTITTRDQALGFLQKYGARPHYEEAPMVRSPFFELFLAYQKFMLLWSQQFLTTFTFTFMPELFPGGLVAFPSHGIQCYINEVTHSFDYESGFTTQANLSAPSALPNGRTNVSEGMIRSFSLGDDLPYDAFADARAQRDTKKNGKGGKK